MLVDITPRGSLTASRIAIAVNSRGAGVSYAGHGQATIGDFHIDANGRVTTKGATIKAEKGVKIALQGPKAGMEFAANLSEIRISLK